MKTLYQITPEIKQHFHPLAVALGTFDGVHRGHQSIIGQVIRRAKEINGYSAVFTFHPHPLSILCPGQAPPLLSSLAQREKLIAELGADLLVVCPFDINFAATAPQDFVKGILQQQLDARFVVVGPNYSFGSHGKGTPSMLYELGMQTGFGVDIMEPVFINQQMVSSTLIRQLIADGEISRATELLGHPFALQGTVVHGDGRGRTLGFPTANLRYDNKMVLPSDGVYLVKVCIGKQSHSGIVNIGMNPTFAVGERRIEIHILDYEGNLYDQKLTIEFQSRLRGEVHFASSTDLIQQITNDVKQAYRMKNISE